MVALRAAILSVLTANTLATLQLTPDNFEQEVFDSGKSAFVKFLAPWWGHCKAMKDDWDALAVEFEGSDVVIADVDCTAEGNEALCEQYGVEGYPTLKTFEAGSSRGDVGDSYEGGRSFDELRTHAEGLGPACSLDGKENCSPEQLVLLEKFAGMSQARRDAKLVKLDNAIKKAEAAHEALSESLGDQYRASEAQLEELTEKLKPQIKLLTAATPSKSA